MKFSCPNPTCGQHLELDDGDVGSMELSCPRCGQLIKIEAEEAPRRAPATSHRATAPTLRAGPKRRFAAAQNFSAAPSVLPERSHNAAAWVVALCLFLLVGGGAWWFRSGRALTLGSATIPSPLAAKEPDVKILDCQLLNKIVERTGVGGRTLSVREEFAQKGGRFLVVHPRLSSGALAGVRLGPGRLTSRSDNEPRQDTGMTLAGVKKKGRTATFTYASDSYGEGMDYLFDVGHFVLHTPDGRTLVADFIGYDLGVRGVISGDDMEIGVPTPLAGDELVAIFSVVEPAAELASFQFRFKNYPALRLGSILGP